MRKRTLASLIVPFALAGVAEAWAQVDAALAALPAGEMEAELGALRLTLEEVRATAAGPATVREQ